MELLPTSAAALLALLVLPNSFLSLLVVDTAFLLVTQSLICVRNLLEFLLCGVRVVLVLVRMVLDGEFLERLLNVLLRGIAFDAEQFVVVFALWRCLLLLALTATAELGRSEA